jgi:hypothetical protein
MARRRRRRTKPASTTSLKEDSGDFFSGTIDQSKIAIGPLVEPNETNPLGGATEGDLAAVVASGLGVDPDMEASEIAIAVDGLARVIAARMAHAEWASDPKQLAVFIVSDRARELATTLAATREPILDNGSRSLTGKLWIAAPSLASGYFAPFAAADPGGMFEEVEAKGIGDMPALVFDPTATDAEIRYYPNGLNRDDRVQRFLIAEELFTLDALDRALTRFYEENIITPDAALPPFDPWKNGSKYIPRERTEAFLQGMLKMILSIAFGTKYRVDFERRGTEGRCDLLIFSRHATVANAWLCHAALELKVLRSFSSGASPVSSTARKKAILDGLLQAIAYKREQAAENGMLCCFDMRMPRHCDGAACFDPIIARATRSKIQLRRYRLYGSSADLRRDKYGESSPAA